MNLDSPNKVDFILLENARKPNNISNGIEIYDNTIDLNSDLMIRQGSGQIGKKLYVSDGKGSIEVVSSGSSATVGAVDKLFNTYCKGVSRYITPVSPYDNISIVSNVHPQIQKSLTGFGGYRYWMVWTPYNNNDSTYENPCIAASNDLENWRYPADNPVIDKPVTPPSTYNADTSLAFNADESMLYMVYRERTPTTNYLKLCHTSDGVNWSTPQTIRTGLLATPQDYGCPSIWFNPNLEVWEIISHNLDATNPDPIQLIKSTNADPYSAWSAPTNLNITPASGYTFWHSHFVRHPTTGVIFGIVSELLLAQSGTNGRFVAVYSTDGQNFVRASITGHSGYRPSIFVGEDDSYYYLLNTLNQRSFSVVDLLSKQDYDAVITNQTASLAGTNPSLAYDTFNRADAAIPGNTGDGKAWTMLTGAAGILTNQLTNPGTAGNKLILNTTSANAKVTAKVNAVPAAGEFFLMLRVQDSSNYVRVGFANGVSKSISMQTIESGVVVTNITIENTTIDFTAPMILGAECNKNSIGVILNNTVIFKTDVPVFSKKTKYGMQFYNSVANTILVDWFLVE